jgi:hypothetical protein
MAFQNLLASSILIYCINQGGLSNRTLLLIDYLTKREVIYPCTCSKISGILRLAVLGYSAKRESAAMKRGYNSL